MHDAYPEPFCYLRTTQAGCQALEAEIFVGAMPGKILAAILPANGMRRVFAIFERDPSAAPFLIDDAQRRSLDPALAGGWTFYEPVNFHKEEKR